MKNFINVLLIAFALNSFAQVNFYYKTASFYEQSQMKTDYKREYLFESDYVTLKDISRDTLFRSVSILNAPNQEFCDHFVKYISHYAASSTDYLPEFAEIFAKIHIYSKGQLNRKAIYHQDKLKYLEVYDNDQKQILDSMGNGQLVEPQFHETRYKIFKDSIQIFDYYVNHSTGDTIHFQLEKHAFPKQGYKEFMRKLSSTISYPASGQRGTMYVRFTINTDGSLSNFECLKGEFSEKFIKRTFKQLERLDPWEPAKLRGTVVKSSYVLPIVYR